MGSPLRPIRSAARKKFVAISNARAVAAFKKTAEGRAVLRIAMAAYHKAFTDGLAERIANRSGGFAANSVDYLVRKMRRGEGQTPWVRSGATLAAVTNNPPEKIGTVRGRSFGINWNTLRAYARVAAFTDRQGNKLPMEMQRRIFRVLQYGSKAHRLGSFYRRDENRGKVITEETVEGGSLLVVRNSGKWRAQRKNGPGLTSSYLVKNKAPRIPGRSLLGWDEAWLQDMERRITAAIGQALVEAGFSVETAERYGVAVLTPDSVIARKIGK